MSPLVTIVVPAVCLGLAYVLGRREWKLYHAAAEIGSDLFVYSRGRLFRRMGGVVVLAALGLTFVALGVAPPRSPTGADVYLGLIVGEVAVLIVLPIWDLLETSRTARPGQGITDRGAARPRTRRPPDPPR
jgi:hypothetical protein